MGKTAAITAAVLLGLTGCGGDDGFDSDAVSNIGETAWGGGEVGVFVDLIEELCGRYKDAGDAREFAAVAYVNGQARAFVDGLEAGCPSASETLVHELQMQIISEGEWSGSSGGS